MAVPYYTPTSWAGLRDAVAGILNTNNVDDPQYSRKLQARANEALAEFTLANPDGLLTRVYRQYLPKQVRSIDEAFLLITTNDPWVMEIVKADGSVLNTGTTTGWLPDITRRWNGLMWIEMDIESTDSSSGATPTSLWQVQTRKWWREGGGIAGPYRYYVSLFNPYPDFEIGVTSNTNIPCRIWARFLYFPQQIARPHGRPRLYRAGPVAMLIQNELEVLEGYGESYNGQSVGVPYKMCRATTVNFPAVEWTPVCSAGDTNSWVGPVQEGVFKFRLTLSMGSESQKHFAGPTSQFEWPLFETAPSPESASWDQTISANQGKAIVISLPNIEMLENFWVPALKRHLQSGWYVRVYVARTSVRAAGRGTVNNVETAGDYQLLTETYITTANPTFTWDGSVIPSREQRLRYHTGTVDGWLPWPLPNQDYVIEWPVAEMPVYFERLQDEIPVRPEYAPAFRELFLAHVARADGKDLELEANCRARYNDLVGAMRSQNRGSATTKIKPVARPNSIAYSECLANYDIGPINES